MKMKDKKAEQKSAKQKHFEQLKAQRRKEPNLERPVPELSQKPSILIVCEGKTRNPLISINSELPQQKSNLLARVTIQFL